MQRREKGMTPYNCLDLSERFNYLYEQYEDTSKLVEVLCRKGEIKQCEHIYVGTSFCGQYFLHLKDEKINELVKWCKGQHIKVSLVIPTFTEKYLKPGKEKIKTYSQYFGEGIDEVIINDYGMLRYIHETYGEQIKLVMGRLFMKDYRDPRYTEYSQKTYKPKIFTPFLEKIMERYQIKGMLFDATHQTMDFTEKPPSIEVGIYGPYTYITVGQICEIGSLDKSIDQKFRPNSSCKEECSHHHIHYFPSQGQKWIRVGKAVYFRNPEVEIKGINNYRRIYCPFDQEDQK